MVPAPSLSHAANRLRWNLKSRARWAGAQHDALNYVKGTLTLPWAAMVGRNTAPSVTGHASMDGRRPSRCNTRMLAGRALNWPCSKQTEAESGWSTPNSASTGAAQCLLHLQTTTN